MSNLLVMINEGNTAWKDDPRQTHEGFAGRTTERVEVEGLLEFVSPRGVHFADMGTGDVEELLDFGDALAADAVSQESVIANIAEMSIRDMCNQTGDEIQDWKCHELFLVGVVVQKLKGDLCAVI